MQNKHKAIALTALSAVLCAFGFSANYSSAEESAANTTYLPDVENLVGVAGNGSVALSWDAVENANSYTVYYGRNSVGSAGGSYESQATSTTNGFVVRNLTAGTPYYFAVAAEDTTGTYAGSYNYSDEVTATPLVAIADTTPTQTATVETSLPAAPAAETQPVTTAVAEKQLPQSGPVANLIFGFSIAAAFLWIKRKKLAAALK